CTPTPRTPTYPLSLHDALPIFVHALGEAAFRLRGALGDGADSLKQFNLPLERATSASLEAIKSFSEGRRLSREQGSLNGVPALRSEEHTSELQSLAYLVCRLLL